MSDEEALEIAKHVWARISDGNMAFGRRMIADAIMFHVNRAIENTYATSVRILEAAKLGGEG